MCSRRNLTLANPTVVNQLFSNICSMYSHYCVNTKNINFCFCGFKLQGKKSLWCNEVYDLNEENI